MTYPPCRHAGNFNFCPVLDITKWFPNIIYLDICDKTLNDLAGDVPSFPEPGSLFSIRLLYSTTTTTITIRRANLQAEPQGKMVSQ